MPMLDKSKIAKNVQKTGLYNNEIIPMSVIANEQKSPQITENEPKVLLIEPEGFIKNLDDTELLEALFQMNGFVPDGGNSKDREYILKQNRVQQVRNMRRYTDWSGANGHMVGWRG